MGFQLLAYSKATGGSVTDQDMVAATDPDFSQRNSHYIFTENYRLFAAYAGAATLVRVAYSVPSWNAIGKFHLWPINLSLDIPSPPAIAWTDEYPPRVPVNEEFQVLQTDTGSETPQVLLWMITDDWSANLPVGKLMIPVRVTATITIVANAWSAIGALTFEQSLRGGVYAVVGAEMQGTHLTGFRLVFPRFRLYHGRKLRPGSLAINAIGDKMDPQIVINPFMFGEWGRFHTFEPPQMDIIGNTNGSTSIEGRLWLVYLGEDVNMLQQGMGGGM